MKTSKILLLVENDENDIMLARQAFRGHQLSDNLRVVTATREAIEYLEGTNAFDDRKSFPFPAVILMDLTLGKDNGFLLLGWLREHPEIRRRLAVIAWTGVNVPGLAEKAYDAGVNSFVIKPFEYEKLLEIVGCINDYWLELNLIP